MVAMPARINIVAGASSDVPAQPRCDETKQYCSQVRNNPLINPVAKGYSNLKGRVLIYPMLALKSIL